jgi:hypothetical protein
MNAHDRVNLEFLLTISEPARLIWWNQASADDKQYAKELLARANLQADVRIAEHFDTINDTDLATEVLKQFRR